MDEVIAHAIKELISKHRCEFDDIIYDTMRARGLLATAPFKQTVVDVQNDAKVWLESFTQEMMKGVSDD